MAQQKNRVTIYAEYAVASSLLWALRILPVRAANLLARGAAALLDRAVPRLRRVGLTNLAFALPELTPQQRSRMINGVFRSMARMLVAMARFPLLNQSNISEWIEYEGLENYLSAKREGRGVLIATAHLGNWELSAFAHALLTEPMHVMVRALDNRRIDAIVEKRRTSSGNRLVFTKDAARAVLQALKENHAVGVLIDQNTSAAEGVLVEFFGKLACAGSAFVKLAQHSGAPVVPGFALWDERKQRYTLRFYPRVELTGNVEHDTQRIHSILEEIIRQYPDQWMWIHRRWKTRPPGEPPLY